VTILVGQNRLGGRILTYRGFAGNMYGEFGAMRFPLQHPMVRWLIQDKFKLATKPFPMYDEDSFIYLQARSPQSRRQKRLRHPHRHAQRNTVGGLIT
jgi:monoamine oxidase